MENKSNLLQTLLIIFGLVLSAYILSNSSFSMKTTQTSAGDESLMTNAISVSGDGTAIAEPDIIYIDVTISEKSYSTKLSQQETNKKISQILEIAKQNKVNEKDIKTTNLSIYPEYEWDGNRNVFKGYSASQSLRIKSAYKKDSQDVSTMLDSIASVEKVQINSISFDFDNKTALAKDAREQAYKSAEEKAQQLATLSGVKLGKPISINDQSYQYNEITPAYGAGERAMLYTADSAKTTQISGGELEHKITLQVIFAIE